jgi:hypothetical protein
MPTETSVSKDSKVTIGLGISLFGALLGGVMWISNQITDNQISLLLINQRLTSIEQSIDTRFDNLRSQIDVHIIETDRNMEDRFRLKEFSSWLDLFEAKNPEITVPKGF